MLNLSFGIEFSDLYDRSGLAKLDAVFVSQLAQTDIALHNQLVTARLAPDSLEAKKESELLIALAPHVEDFIAELFSIRKELIVLKEAHHKLAPLYSCKRLFVQRRATKAYKPEEIALWDGTVLAQKLGISSQDIPDFELAFSTQVMQWLDQPELHKDNIDAALQYAAWALLSQEGQHKHKDGILFKAPRKLDMEHLVPVETEIKDGVTVLKLSHHRHREGFALTDNSVSLLKGMDEANYCIWCHNQGKDSCSKGMREKTGEFKKTVFDVILNGCPLEEKISEMHVLKAEGVPVGALAMVTVDNPMVAGTGHRICNDCMKACIYQKQDPVNIPLAETDTLKNVLSLPYGFEIYSLLTRWNPLNLRRPLPKMDSGYKVLVAGLGPSGYTLAHHLLNDGHTVMAVDGLKIEPLPEEISGVTSQGEPVAFKPIRDIAALYESLDDRVLAGFGGVAEYGITVRWDKNYLKILRLLLERRRSFSMTGGVRFGSTLTIESAFELEFDHIALCMGAGKPTLLDVPNAVARGVRAASDFLMALQLTGAAKKDSIANLQLRLPVVVIGGGLTAIDTATESLAYYPVQVEKFLRRYEILVQLNGQAAVEQNWSAEEAEIAREFIAHAEAIRAERALAAKEVRDPDIWTLLDSWGGVKLVYRKRLIDAPSYRLNHEEVEKALEEGIFIAESWEPIGVDVDGYGHAKSIRLRYTDRDKQEEVTLPARAILVAAGTSPNTVLARETEGITLHNRYFQALDEEGKLVAPERVAKPAVPQMLMALEQDGRAISFFGDLHPSFAGNVVKAMGSAKQGYPVVTRVLHKRVAGTEPGVAFLSRMNGLLRATVHQVNRLTPTIVEVVVKAQLAAKQFQPGQFYRLQNFEHFAVKTEIAGQATTLAMEGLAMTGAWVDKKEGLVSVIALEMGGSSDLCAYLKPGEPVILMGPTGSPTHIERGETVMLVGGGLGNAVLFSIGKALREAGSRVLYFAGYKKLIDRYKVTEIEEAADQVIWCSDEAPGFMPGRPKDGNFHGNIVDTIEAYAQGKLGAVQIALSDVNRIIAIGSDRMMAAVGAARHGKLKSYLKPDHIALGSINSPMQCMMKEICAQCIQKHVDPVTGIESFVYSCFNQDQLLDQVSFPHLNERLLQNSLQEKITKLWIDACLKEEGLRSISI